MNDSTETMATAAELPPELEVTPGQVRRGLVAIGVPPRHAARSAAKLYSESLGVPTNDTRALERAAERRARRAARP